MTVFTLDEVMTKESWVADVWGFCIVSISSSFHSFKVYNDICKATPE